MTFISHIVHLIHLSIIQINEQVKILNYIFLKNIFMGSLELIYQLFKGEKKSLNSQKHRPTCRKDSVFYTVWYFPVQFLNYSDVFNDFCILIN